MRAPGSGLSTLSWAWGGHRGAHRRRHFPRGTFIPIRGSKMPATSSRAPSANSPNPVPPEMRLGPPQFGSATPIPLDPAPRGLVKRSKIHKTTPTQRTQLEKPSQQYTFHFENERLDPDLIFGLNGANNSLFHSLVEDLSCTDLFWELKELKLFSPPRINIFTRTELPTSFSWS